jgi:hypothetical protein
MTYAKNSKSLKHLQRLPQLGQPITRAFIGSILYDSDDNDQVGQSQAEDPEIVVEAAYAQKVSDDGAVTVTVDAILQGTRNWLEELAQGEHSRVVEWGLEFRFQHSLSPFIGLSTEGKTILRRISEGHGPRAFTPEDLIAPLRLTEPGADDALDQPSLLEETYEDQLEALLMWNKNVASIPDLTKERENLYILLEERCQIMAEVEQHLRTPGDIDNQSHRLRKALRAFRPDISRFENRSSLNALVIMVANFRIAQPDIDLVMRDKMIETIFKENRLMMRTDKQHDIRDHQLDARLQSAYESNNRTVVRCLRKEKRDLFKEDMRLCAEQTIDCIKAARRAIYQQTLVELQDLVVPQVGLKLAVLETLSIPYDLLRESLLTDDAINRMQEHLANAEAACDADLANVANMLTLTQNCYERVERFRAEDVRHVTDAERERIKLERMKDPETYSKMMRVVDDKHAISQIPEIVEAHMVKLDESLGLAVEIAKNQLREFDGWQGVLVDEDVEVDLGLALVGKLVLEASAKETAGRSGSRTSEVGADDKVVVEGE